MEFVQGQKLFFNSTVLKRRKQIVIFDEYCKNDDMCHVYFNQLNGERNAYALVAVKFLSTE